MTYLEQKVLPPSNESSPRDLFSTEKKFPSDADHSLSRSSKEIIVFQELPLHKDETSLYGREKLKVSSNSYNESDDTNLLDQDSDEILFQVKNIYQHSMNTFDSQASNDEIT